MKKSIFVKLLCASSVCVPAFVCAQAAPASSPTSFTTAILGGKAHGDIRYRYEYVDQTGIANAATANTLRTRLSYQTDKFKGFTGLVEFENITGLFNENYNDTINGRTTYATVPDPEDTLVNRAFIEYTGIPKTTLTIGRQGVAFDNQRFVGGSAWRQNDVTFDALTFKNTAIPNTTIAYVYANKVNRVFGTHSVQGTWHDTNIHLLNVAYSTPSFGKLSAYSYMLDIPQSLALTTSTYGVRYDVTKPIATGRSLGIAVEMARQSDYALNPANYAMNYYSIEPVLNIGQWQFKAQYESIEGDGTRAFQFPLGSNHIFDGWVDKFLTTPNHGLIDANLSVRYTVRSTNPILNNLKATLAYHDFASQSGNMNYGTEWNVLVEQTIKTNYTLGVKIGSYNANGLFTDTYKFMPYIAFKF
jgi:hypothetical protein